MGSAATVVERTGPAIRAVLAEVSPADCVRFEQEFAVAAERAGREIDAAPLDAVLDRWWRIAVVRQNPLSDAERSLVARARAGDFAGWLPGPDGM